MTRRARRLLELSAATRHCRRPRSVFQDRTRLWPTVVNALCKQVETHIGSEFTNTMVRERTMAPALVVPRLVGCCQVAKFSTSTPVTVAASQIVLLGAMSLSSSFVVD